MQGGLPVLASINAGNDLAGMVQRENVGRVSEDGTVDTLTRLALDLIDSLDTDVNIPVRCRALYTRLFAPETAVRQITTALRDCLD